MANVGVLVAQRPTITAVAGAGGAGLLTAQRAVIESHAIVGVVGGASLVAKRYVIDTAGGRVGGNLVAQRPEVSAAGIVGIGASASLVAQRAEVESAGYMGYTELTYLYWKRPRITARGTMGIIGTASLTYKRHKSSTTGYRGATNATTVRLVAQRPSVSARGYLTAVGAATLTAQRPVIGIQIDNASESWIAFAMNSLHHAVTEYDQYQFNSFARLGDRVLAASDSGLFELAGDDDEGSDIEASAKTGRYNFGSPLRKVATDVYGAYDCDNDMDFRVFHRGSTYSYRMPKKGVDGVVMHKANLGQGLRDNFHQYGFANRAGTNFNISGFTVLVDVLSSRV